MRTRQAGTGRCIIVKQIHACRDGQVALPAHGHLAVSRATTCMNTPGETRSHYRPPEPTAWSLHVNCLIAQLFYSAAQRYLAGEVQHAWEHAEQVTVTEAGAYLRRWQPRCSSRRPTPGSTSAASTISAPRLDSTLARAAWGR